MGLKLGKAALHDAVKPFCKLAKSSVMKLITAYQNISDGFGVSMNEMAEIAAELHDELQIAPDVVKLIATHLFKLLDTDNNGLVDGLEFLSIIALCSGMKKTEMVEFSLTLYDFNNAAALTFDELVLALKSACGGLSKVYSSAFEFLSRERLSPPSEEKLEHLASLVFHGSAADPKASISEIDMSLHQKNIKELTDELLCIPEVSSWLSFFCNFSEDRDVPHYTQAEISNILVTKLDPPHHLFSEKDVVQWNVHYPGPSKIAREKAQWRDEVAHLTPLAFANTPINRQMPNFRVCVDWVYGYEVQNARKNVCYTHSHDILYFVGKLAILYSLKTHAQKLFTGHSEEISVMQIHPELQYVATGEGGYRPTVLVWSTDTLEVLHTSQGAYRDGVSQLCFSPSGDILVVVDNAPIKHLTVWRWKENNVVYKAAIEAELVHAALVLPRDVFVISADCDLFFWNKYSEGYFRREGIFLKNKAKEAITCTILAKHSDGLIAGTISGKIMMWHGVNCTRQVRAHSGPVNVLHGCFDGFLSGGKDSRIRMWSVTMEPKFIFDVSQFGLSTSVRSVCLSRDATTILFATADADVFEISAIDGSDLRGGPVVQSHSFGQINCLDTHPSKFEFVTIGSDRTVRIVDMKNNSLLRMARLDTEGRAVAYSPVGDTIAVGTDNAGNFGCMFVILNEETLTILHAARDTRYPVTAIKFSPEGDTLAVGTADGGILLYSVHEDFELVARCSRHTSAIIGMDFSKEGEWLRSNSLLGELYFFNVDDGTFQSNTPSMRDVLWNSQECMFSWHTKGIHALEQVVERVTCCTVPHIEDRKLLACGSTLGQLRFFAFPAASDGAEVFRFPAHCNAVADVRFSFDGRFLLSVGKQDRCVLQWRIDSNVESIELQNEDSFSEALQEILFELADGEQLLREFLCRPLVPSVGLLNDIRESVSQELFWTSPIAKPSNDPLFNKNLPYLPLRLHHVYGFETNALRNNICYISGQEISYTCSNFAIMWNNAAASQRVYKMHTNKITAFAYSRSAGVLATGEVGEFANVYVWDPRTMDTLYTLPEKQAFSVCCAGFSPDGSLLAVVSNDKMHTVSVYDWRHNALHCKLYAGENKILAITFHTSPECLELLTVGVKHVKFWRQVKGMFPECVVPNFAEIGRMQTFLCCVSFSAMLVVGTADGNLYVFRDRALRQVVKAHVGSVLSLCTSPDGANLFSGGQDGALRQWDSCFECRREVSLDSLSKNHVHGVRAIAAGDDGDSIAVGTQGGEVLEISLRDCALKVDGINLKGHHTQMWGLTVHPNGSVFATTGDDAILRLWDFRTCSAIRTIKLELASRAVCFSPNGRLLAIGFGSGRRVKGKLHAKEGALMVVNYDNFKTIFDGKDSSMAITVVAFSPDNKLLVVGSEDCCVYAYNVQEQFSLRYTIQSHQAALRSLDFSHNGYFLMSIDVAERVFYTISSSGISTSSADDVKDEQWVTHNNPLSWETVGLWLTLPDSAKLTCCAKSHNGMFMLAANSCGDVSLSRFPAPQKVGFQLASRHVGRVSLSWMSADEGFLTGGVDDCAVLQWNILPLSDDVQSIDLHPSIPAETMHQFERENMLCDPLVSPFKKMQKDIHDNGHRITFPWPSMISEPTKKPSSASARSLSVQEAFVHGWRRDPALGGLHYNSDGDLVCCASNVGIVFDRNRVCQRHYLEHRGEISALTMSHSRRFVATGDTQHVPELHIWDSMVCQKIIVFREFARNCVLALAFSRSARYVVALSGDCLQSVCVFFSPTGQWTDGFFHSSASVTSNPLCWCLFAESRDFSIVCGGADGILHTFRLQSDNLVPSMVAVETMVKHRTLLCGLETLFADERLGVEIPALLIGTSDGLLYVISGANQTLRRVSAHNSELHAIALAPQSRVSYDSSHYGTEALLGAHRVLTLGGDGHVCCWSASLKPLQKINISKLIVPSTLSAIAVAVAFSPERDSVVLGFDQGDLWELSLGGHNSILLSESHHCRSGQLHGLAWNPMNSEEYATIGDEGILKVWHSSLRYCTRRKMIKFASRAIAWSPSGDVIVVGLGTPDRERMSPKDGAIVIVEASSLKIIREEKKAKKWIIDIQFSSSGQQIAAASADGRVYIVDLMLSNLRVIEVDTQRPALRVDFSFDSSMLRIAFQPDHLVFFNLTTGEIEHNPLAAKDVEWYTHSCPFSWHTQGLFAAFAVDDVNHSKTSSLTEPSLTLEALVVTATAVNLSRGLLCAAFENGEIRLYNYPHIESTDKAAFFLVKRLSSFASKLAINTLGTILVAIDAKSRTLFQWTIPSTQYKNNSMAALSTMRRK